MGKLTRRIHYFLHRRQHEADLAEEMAHHLALKEHDSGADARREMGNATLAREDARAVWIWPWLESVWQDLAYGFRTMRRQPGFTAIALAALGITVGLNTTFFTLFNAIALRPWPVNDPARVANVFHFELEGPRRSTHGFSVAAFRYYEEHARSFTGLILQDQAEAKLDNQPLVAMYVSGKYFGVLGIPMERGRGFLAEEDRVGAPQAVAVISHRLWENHFAADPDIVGRLIRLDDIPVTVVGVASRDFNGSAVMRTDVWLPLAARLLLRPNDPEVRSYLTSPNHCCSWMAGRLANGYTREQAAAELETLERQFRPRQQGEERTSIIVTGTALIDIPNRNRAKAAPVFGLLFLAVTLVLLLACANIGNLLLARAVARRQEIAIRLSVGGSRWRVVRQLMVESFALALAAAAIGIGLAFWLPSYALSRIDPNLSFRLTPDLQVLGYDLLLAILACLAFGLAPALQATRGRIFSALRDDLRLPGIRIPLRSVLLSSQVAISVILLAGAGLLLRGLQRATVQDPGFAIQNVSVVSIDLPASAYGDAQRGQFAARLAAEIERPGMPPAGLSMDAPLGNSITSTAFAKPGEGHSRRHIVVIHEVTGGYFDALRIPIVAGRNFTARDAGRPVALINETAAAQYWRGENPVGKTIETDKQREIVGVVKDAYTTRLGSVDPTMYWPMEGKWIARVLVRSGGTAATERIAAIVKQIEPRAQTQIEPLSENFRRALEPSLQGAALAGGLGLLALALASIGMSGVFAFLVRQRTREIGIRMALGADARSVVRLVMSSSLRTVGIGLAVGLAGAAAISRLLAGQFSGVRSIDPLAYAGVVVILAGAAAVAGLAPARCAARVDPVRALRWE
ncbi:MAG TPA: ADOP family duplicated permease [Bryobacteraceae bacterium]|jgi:predicted permease